MRNATHKHIPVESDEMFQNFFEIEYSVNNSVNSDTNCFVVYIL